MAGTFKFELVSPERILLSVDADQVVVPGADGDFAVLAGHAPVIATLRPGVLGVTAGGTRKRLFVKSGFCEVDPSRGYVPKSARIMLGAQGRQTRRGCGWGTVGIYGGCRRSCSAR